MRDAGMRPMIGYSPLVEKALRCAAIAHGEQTRKGTEVPYITHPAHVAMILVRHGITEEVALATAILHDVLEDTDYPADRVRGEFPASVWEGLQPLTETKLDANGNRRPWSVRKAEHREHVANAAWWVRGIALADKIHNLGTMWSDLQEDDRVWGRFNASPEESLRAAEQLIEAAEGGEERLRSLAEEARMWLGKLRGHPSSGAKAD